MATESKITEPKSAEPEVQEQKVTKSAAKVTYIRAVFGKMVDPHTALEYSQVPSELLKRTGWVDSQLAAKKMELVDL